MSSTVSKPAKQQRSQPASNPIVLNGDLSSDSIQRDEPKTKKGKKKHKRDKSEGEAVPQEDQAPAMPPPSKKRK